MKVNIFCRPEEAILENWQKLVSKQKYFSFLRENLNLVQLNSCYQTERETSISVQSVIFSRKYLSFKSSGIFYQFIKQG